MPGTSSDANAATRKFIAIASHNHGASANTTHAAATRMPTIASMRSPSPGSRNMSRDASGMPRSRATIWPGSAKAATIPRWKSSRWKICS